MTTPTPRTDALIRFEFGPTDQPFPAHALLAMIQLAKELERDLAAAQEELAAIRKTLGSEMVLVHEARTDREMLRNALVKESGFRQETERQLAAAQEARQRAEALAERRLAEAQALVKDHATILDALERAEALAEQNAKDAKEAIAIAGFLFDAWEDGTPCFETDGESGMGASIGNAFKLSNEDFTRCTEFLNRVDPRGAAINAASKP